MTEDLEKKIEAEFNEWAPSSQSWAEATFDGEALFEAYFTGYLAAQKEIEVLKSELHQQRFNNEHNLSIDQKVADEIKELREALDWATKESRHSFPSRAVANKMWDIRKQFNLDDQKAEK